MKRIKSLTPILHRIVVKLVKFEDTVKSKNLTRTKAGIEEISDGGIVVEIKDHDAIDRQQKGMEEAVVVDIGPTAFGDFGDGKLQVKIGDVVSIVRYAGGQDYTIGEDTFRAINDIDIVAIVQFEEVGDE